MVNLRHATHVVALSAVALVLAACELATHSSDFATQEQIVEGGIGCPSSQQTCVSDAGAVSCASLSSDNANCGACGHACSAGFVCSGGNCQTSCSAGETSCASGCVDVTSDPANCGGCGTACTKKQVCSGSCTAGCAAGLKECSGSCVAEDYGTQCGLCAGNVTCAAGDKCTLGFCEAVAICESMCNGVCVDPLTDKTNCGSCGNVCPGLQTCSNGKCSGCPTGSIMCSGACVDFTDDPKNCGSCGTMCAAGSFCANVGLKFTCAACPATEAQTPIVCGNSCTYAKTDPSNCGSCGNRCASGVCAAGVCSK